MLIWFVLISGIFNVALAFITNTNSLIDSLLLKVIPFLLGIACIVYVVGELGYIQINF